MFIKKIVFLLFGLLLFIHLNAQKVKRKGVTPFEVSNKTNTPGNTPVITIDQLLGKWQEVARIEKPGIQIRFTDTIFLHFTATDAVTTKRENEFAYNDAVEIAPPGNVLLVAGDVYTI